MEKSTKPCDKESMRLAILKHEETFREQVCELHRLYQVQRILMRNIQSKKHTEEHQERWNLLGGARFIQTRYHDDTKHKPEIRRFLLEQPAQESIPDSCGSRSVEETIEETEIKLTLGPSSYITRKKPERKLTSESTQSFSSSSESSHLNRTCANKELRLFQVPELNSGSRSESKSNIEIEEQLRKEILKQPPCVFQVLSLNMAREKGDSCLT